MTAYGGKDYGQVWFNIVQDGHVKGSGVTGNGDNAQVGGIFAMIRCYVGSHIWVKQRGDRPPWRQGMWGGHSQFGGFKIAI